MVGGLDQASGNNAIEKIRTLFNAEGIEDLRIPDYIVENRNRYLYNEESLAQETLQKITDIIVRQHDEEHLSHVKDRITDKIFDYFGHETKGMQKRGDARKVDNEQSLRLTVEELFYDPNSHPGITNKLESFVSKGGLALVQPAVNIADAVNVFKEFRNNPAEAVAFYVRRLEDGEAPTNFTFGESVEPELQQRIREAAPLILTAYQQLGYDTNDFSTLFEQSDSAKDFRNSLQNALEISQSNAISLSASAALASFQPGLTTASSLAYITPEPINTSAGEMDIYDALQVFSKYSDNETMPASRMVEACITARHYSRDMPRIDLKEIAESKGIAFSNEDVEAITQATNGMLRAFEAKNGPFPSDAFANMEPLQTFVHEMRFHGNCSVDRILLDDLAHASDNQGTLLEKRLKTIGGGEILSSDQILELMRGKLPQTDPSKENYQSDALRVQDAVVDLYDSIRHTLNREPKEVIPQIIQGDSFNSELFDQVNAGLKRRYEAGLAKYKYNEASYSNNPSFVPISTSKSSGNLTAAVLAASAAPTTENPKVKPMSNTEPGISQPDQPPAATSDIQLPALNELTGKAKKNDFPVDGLISAKDNRRKQLDVILPALEEAKLRLTAEELVTLIIDPTSLSEAQIVRQLPSFREGQENAGKAQVLIDTLQPLESLGKLRTLSEGTSSKSDQEILKREIQACLDERGTAREQPDQQALEATLTPKDQAALALLDKHLEFLNEFYVTSDNIGKIQTFGSEHVFPSEINGKIEEAKTPKGELRDKLALSAGALLKAYEHYERQTDTPVSLGVFLNSAVPEKDRLTLAKEFEAIAPDITLSSTVPEQVTSAASAVSAASFPLTSVELAEREAQRTLTVALACLSDRELSARELAFTIADTDSPEAQKNLQGLPTELHAFIETASKSYNDFADQNNRRVLEQLKADIESRWPDIQAQRKEAHTKTNTMIETLERENIRLTIEEAKILIDLGIEHFPGSASEQVRTETVDQVKALPKDVQETLESQFKDIYKAYNVFRGGSTPDLDLSNFLMEQDIRSVHATQLPSMQPYTPNPVGLNTGGGMPVLQSPQEALGQMMERFERDGIVLVAPDDVYKVIAINPSSQEEINNLNLKSPLSDEKKAKLRELIKQDDAGPVWNAYSNSQDASQETITEDAKKYLIDKAESKLKAHIGDHPVNTDQVLHEITNNPNNRELLNRYEGLYLHAEKASESIGRLTKEQEQGVARILVREIDVALAERSQSAAPTLAAQQPPQPAPQPGSSTPNPALAERQSLRGDLAQLLEELRLQKIALTPQKALEVITDKKVPLPNSLRATRDRLSDGYQRHQTTVLRGNSEYALQADISADYIHQSSTPERTAARNLVAHVIKAQEDAGQPINPNDIYNLVTYIWQKPSDTSQIPGYNHALDARQKYAEAYPLPNPNDGSHIERMGSGLLDDINLVLQLRARQQGAPVQQPNGPVPPRNGNNPQRPGPQWQQQQPLQQPVPGGVPNQPIFTNIAPMPLPNQPKTSAVKTVLKTAAVVGAGAAAVAVLTKNNQNQPQQHSSQQRYATDPVQGSHAARVQQGQQQYQGGHAQHQQQNQQKQGMSTGKKIAFAVVAAVAAVIVGTKVRDFMQNREVAKSGVTR